MGEVALIYAGFALLSGLVLALAPLRMGLLVVVLGGWLLLPVGDYPQARYDTLFPFWIIGVALPSDMLLTKAWVVPLTALCGGLVRSLAGGRDQWPRLRPGVADLPVLLWCLWPLLVGAQWGAPDPAPWVASAYLLGSWGSLWLIGRLWFAGPDGHGALMLGLALAGLACLPVAVVEMPGIASLYDLLYRPHPYGQEGAVRQLFQRPVGMFEHGNQYGIWTALCALAALWVAAVRRGGWIALALVVLGIGVLHQSRGAVLLLLLGLVLLAVWRLRLAWLGLGLGLALLAVALGVHYSGAVLSRLVAAGLSPGDLRGFLDSSGLHTLAYRLWQDFRARDLVMAAPWVGHGAWDWWRPEGRRPWGFPVLAAGQFGVPAVLAALTVLLATPLAALSRLRRQRPWRAEVAAIPLAVIVLLALGDAILNSFLFFPAILAAGALAGVRADVRPEAAPEAGRGVTQRAGG